MHRAARFVALCALPLFGCVAPPQAVPVEQPARVLRAPLDDAAPLDDRLPAKPKKTAHEPEPWPFDVQHYDVRVDLDFDAHTIVGVVTIDVVELEHGVEFFPLDCEELEVLGVVEFDTRPVDFVVHDGRLMIPIPGGSKEGRRVSYAVAYRGKPRLGLYFQSPPPGSTDVPYQAFSQGECIDTRHWIPCHDWPNDQATHEMHVTVPNDFVVCAAGELTGVKDGDTTDTWHYRMDVPHVSYLMTCVAGEYEVIREDGMVPLEYVVEERDVEHAAFSLRRTDDILRFLSDYTGRDYPYHRYAQSTVRNFMFGGMENISATTLTDRTIHPPSWEPMRTSHGLVAHEAAHQWFGDLMTCEDWPHIWLNEGFATYFTQLWFEHDEGLDAFRTRMRGTMNGATGACERARRAAVSNVYATPFDLFFDGHAYGGGAARLHMLRGEVGDDVFREIVRRYVAKHGGTTVITDDFEAIASGVTGTDMGWFFDQWFHTPGRPKLNVSWELRDMSTLVTVEQTHEAKGGTPDAYRLSLDVMLDTQPENPALSVRLDVTRRNETFEINVPASRVRVDPGRYLIARIAVERPLDEWIGLMNDAPWTPERLDAVDAIGKIARDKKRVDADRVRARAALDAAAVGAESFHVRKAAFGQVKRRNDEASAELMLGALQAEPDPRIRLDLVNALGGRTGAPDSAPVLRTIADGDNDLLRAAALRALAKRHTGDAYERLVAALDRPGWHSHVRSAALEGFADLGDERAFDLLVQYAAVESDSVARPAAIQALGRMGRDRSEYTEAVLAHADDPSRAVRGAVIDALRTLEDPAALATLLAAFHGDPWRGNRDKARRAIVACRRAAVEAGSQGTIEAARAHELRAAHPAADGDERKRLEAELEALGVPVPPAPAVDAGSSK